MKQIKGFKTELDPNNVQKTLLAKAAGCARFAFNWGLARRIEEYKTTGKSSSGFDQRKQLNALKATEFPWMYEVSKCAPQEALRDLDVAYINFYRRVKNGEKPGFPKFKSKHKTTPSFRITADRVTVSRSAIRISRVGSIRLKESDYLPVAGALGVKTLSITIKQSGGGRWFVGVVCEIEVSDPIMPPNVVESIGIDLGLKAFAVLSDGSKYESPKPLKKSLKKLKRLHKQVSRKVKGSKNRRKVVKRLSAQHFKVACQRKDFLHKLTSMLVKTKPAKMYVIEDLNVTGMMQNRKLSRAISDAGWCEFGRQLTYKAKDQIGAVVVRADRFFASSKTCSFCGHKKDCLDLSERIFHCESCGKTIDRDDNAAINLKNYLPPVRREDTPVERSACKGPRGSRKKTALISSGIGA